MHIHVSYKASTCESLIHAQDVCIFCVDINAAFQVESSRILLLKTNGETYTQKDSIASLISPA